MYQIVQFIFWKMLPVYVACNHVPGWATVWGSVIHLGAEPGT